MVCGRWFKFCFFLIKNCYTKVKVWQALFHTPTTLIILDFFDLVIPVVHSRFWKGVISVNCVTGVCAAGFTGLWKKIVFSCCSNWKIAVSNGDRHTSISLPLQNCSLLLAHSNFTPLPLTGSAVTTMQWNSGNFLILPHTIIFHFVCI